LGDTVIYFEDVEVEKVATAGPYLLTKEEIVEFSSKWDPFNFHTEEAAADESIFGGLAASGVHTVCIFNRLCHDVETLAVRAVVEHQFRYPNPARPGDQIWLESKEVWTKESKSRPDIGVVGGESRLINQDGLEVLTVASVVFVSKRGNTS
jgi:acyl dehydratase